MRRGRQSEEFAMPRPSRFASPSLARRLAGATTAALAMMVASSAFAQSTIRDTEVEGIIREWSDPVFSAMGLEPSEIEVLLVNDPELNAFATRGRIIGINTGLILRTQDANQLLGVLAHEAGHVKNRHTLRDGAQDAGMQPFLMSMALGALAIVAGEPGAGAALLGSSQYFGTLNALRYIQSQEGEADITAQRGLEAAGESGRGLVRILRELPQPGSLFRRAPLSLFPQPPPVRSAHRGLASPGRGRLTL